MSHLKKLLLITFWIFASIESSSTGAQKKLKQKIQRPNKKIVKEVEQIFTTDDQSQIAKEVNDVQLLAQTPEQKQEVAQALQKEIVKQTKEIKNDLEKDNKSIPKYIEYMDALDIIKSKKELSEIKKSSWTDSYIIKPLTKTYRLFLRVWDQKKYAELLETERKSLEHALNVQAHNNIMLLYVALDLATKQQDLNIEHMFKKDNFYKTMIHAFEGGALFASDIQLSNKVKDLITELNMLITQNFEKISTNKAIVQSIWQMNEILWETQHPREGYRIKHGLTPEKDINYDWFTIKDLCEKAAKKNGQKLVENKESYTKYLQTWILQPKNVAKVGFAIAAIGGLYIYGPAVPAWLKEYSTSSIGSIKGALSKGYNATISSVKNLWNTIFGHKTQEMPNSKETRMDAQQQQSDLDDYFIQQGTQDAQEIERKDIEFKENLKDLEFQVSLDRAFDYTDEKYKQIKAEDSHGFEWGWHADDLERQKALELKKQEQIERETLKEYQRSAKKADDFEQEIEANLIIQKDAEIIKDLIERDETQTKPGSEYETAEKIKFNPTSTHNLRQEITDKANTIIKDKVEAVFKVLQKEHPTKNVDLLRLGAAQIVSDEAKSIVFNQSHNKLATDTFDALEKGHSEISDTIITHGFSVKLNIGGTNRRLKKIETEFKNLEKTSPEEILYKWKNKQLNHQIQSH